MRTESQKCKGARDLLPLDMKRFRKIETAFIELCEKWGYEEIRTPTLEYLHLFTSAGTLTPAMLNKVYSFLDWDGWSGERVVLRPDGTIPVARLYLENLSKNEIAKLFYVTNVFSFESTGKDNRERWQCGVEYLGSNDPVSDIEIIMLASTMLNKIDIQNVQLKLSHAGFLKSLLGRMELDAEYYKKVVNALNKGNWDYFAKVTGKNTKISSIISLFSKIRGESSDYLENMKSLQHISNDVISSIDQFASITRLLDALKCKYEVDITSTENFEYYTGLYFKFIKNNHTICSGGRYNDLLPLMSGKHTPACGFAIHMDPIIKLTGDSEPRKISDSIPVILSQANAANIALLFDLINTLNNNGFTVAVNFTDKSMLYRWNIKVNSDAPYLILTDQQNNRTFKPPTISRLIKYLKVEK